MVQTRVYGLGDVFLRVAISYGPEKGNIENKHHLSRLLAFLGFDYQTGRSTSPRELAAIFLCLSKKYYKLTLKNQILFKHMMVREPISGGNESRLLFRILRLHTTSIATIDLTLCYDFVTDEALIQIAELCPSLKTCILWGCHYLTDPSIIKLAELCPFLVELNVGGCVLLSDKCIMVVAQNMFYLHSLNISGCYRLTDTCLEPFHLYSRVLMTLSEKDYPLDIQPSRDDLDYFPTNFRKFACQKVVYRKLGRLQQFIMYFCIRPRAVESWESLLTAEKFKPHLTTRDGETTYFGIFEGATLKVLNNMNCSRLSQKWYSSMCAMHPNIHIVAKRKQGKMLTS